MSSTTPSRPHRVLACALCQQRKIKCSRSFPCTHCVRLGVECVPADSLGPRPRRRRFAERELLERLRHYEDVLRENRIDFEPLHADGASSDVPKEKGGQAREAIPDLWHAMSRATLTLQSENDSEDGVGGDHAYNAALEKAWRHRYESQTLGLSGNELLLGSLGADFDLSLWHPGQVQIFKLWQVYLENVDPLLKVTHKPTLQSRIIDAASNVANISPALEALMFSIYCVSLLSLTEQECRASFKSSRKDLLNSYQFACQHALMKCNALRSTDLDSLTAFYLFLLSIRPVRDPLTMCSMLAVVIRIAKRMGLHSEATNTGHTALEAELRRRLWWSLVSFDHRNCEMSEYKLTTLVPTWNCCLPMSLNDFELRPDVKEPPPLHPAPTEAVFIATRAELADFIRHRGFHLDMVNPSLRAVAQPRGSLQNTELRDDEFATLEQLLDRKYLTSCHADDPLHYMTIWTTRGSIARQRLLEHYSRNSTSPQQLTDAHRSDALEHSLSMLECDTKIRTSHLSNRFVWFADYHLPALAYLHIWNELKKQPGLHQAERAWTAMSENYESLSGSPNKQWGGEEIGQYGFFVRFSDVLMQAWDVQEAWNRENDKPYKDPPGIVLGERVRMANDHTHHSMHSNEAQLSRNDVDPIDIAEPSLSTPLLDLAMPGQAFVDPNLDPVWAEMDWVRL